MNQINIDEQLELLALLDCGDEKELPTPRLTKNMYAKQRPSIDSLRRQKKYLEKAITHLEKKLIILEDVCDFCWELELKYRTVKKLHKEFETLLVKKVKDFDTVSEYQKKKKLKQMQDGEIPFKYRKKDFENNQQF